MSFAKSIDPAADHSRFEAAKELKEQFAVFTLWLDDALQEMLDVRGVTIDAWVKCQLKRIGRNGPIEIDYLDVRNVYVYFPQGFDDRVKINQSDLPEKINEEFQTKLEAYLKKRGQESFDWQVVDHGE